MQRLMTSADSDAFQLENVRVGNTPLSLNLRRQEFFIGTARDGSEECAFEFRPAISLRASVGSRIKW